MSPPKECYRIAPFHKVDRSAVREICAAAAWLGEPAPERIADEWIWAEFWTRYFTDREPANSWVVRRADDGAAAGYLTGTADVARFDRYTPFLLPGIVCRAVRKRLMRHPEPRRAILGLLRSFAAGELALPPGVADAFPATFHLNLLPEARRRGFGRALLETFLDRMRKLGVAGIHAQPLSVNEPIERLLQRTGFRCVASGPCGAFAHVDPTPMAIRTWVLGL